MLTSFQDIVLVSASGLMAPFQVRTLRFPNSEAEVLALTLDHHLLEGVFQVTSLNLRLTCISTIAKVR
jgi:hypothetical protein